MGKDDLLRRELLALLKGGNAHMTFEEAVADVPGNRINASGPHMPYSLWHLLEHMRLVQWDIVAFVQDPGHVSPEWPQGYFPAPDRKADAKRWRESVEGFLADRAVLEKIAADPHKDLFAPIPHAREYTLFREILLAADHNAYHIGELASLRQILGAWPAGRPLYDEA